MIIDFIIDNSIKITINKLVAMPVSYLMAGLTVGVIARILGSMGSRNIS